MMSINGTNGHRQLRLRYVGTANFRFTDANQLDMIIKELGKSLTPNECIILVSTMGKTLRFIFGAVEHKMTTAKGQVREKMTRVVPSVTYRITDGGTFNPYMLQNYANDLGIELAHLKRLEAHLRSQGVSA